MPTKKPAKKRAPRTDWKARALHCEEVIGVQNVLAGARKKAHGEVLAHNGDLLVRNEELRKKLCDATDYGMELEKQVGLEVKLRDEYWERALAAEKHNAILLAEREVWATTSRHCEICADNVPPSCDGRCELLGRRVTRAGSSTLYQRLKAWAAKWSIEITCALAILAVFAGASWYALRWGK